MKSEIIFHGSLEECLRFSAQLTLHTLEGEAWRVIIHPAAPMGQFQVNATLK